MKKVPLGVAQPPHGFIYLGRGGTFKKPDPNGLFYGLATLGGPVSAYEENKWFGDGSDLHFFARQGSFIDELNRPWWWRLRNRVKHPCLYRTLAEVAPFLGLVLVVLLVILGLAAALTAYGESYLIKTKVPCTHCDGTGQVDG